jgi:hypothetical protein
MFDLWAPEHSVLREKVLEHAFLTELSKVLLLDLRTPFEVLRSEFDVNGYDLIIEACGVVRHIQLKASRVGGKRASANINVALAQKPSGCVVWIMVDDALNLGPFHWLGGAPGECLGPVAGRIGKHSKANSAGFKAERQAIRIVPKGRFRRVETIGALANELFGDIDSGMPNRLTEMDDTDPARWRAKTDFLPGVDLTQPASEMRYQLLNGQVHTLQRNPDGSIIRGHLQPAELPFTTAAEGWYSWDGTYLGVDSSSIAKSG